MAEPELGFYPRRWMGHKSLETTMRYLVPSKDVHARMDQMTIPGLPVDDVPSRKAPKTEANRVARSRGRRKEA